MNAHIDFLKSIHPTDQLADQDRQQARTDWPQKTPQSLKDKIASLFLEEMSSKALETFTCASCSEACLISWRISVDSQDICLTPLHRPDHWPSLKNAHSCVDDQWLDLSCSAPPLQDNLFDPAALLDPRGIHTKEDNSGTLLSFCSDCHACILKSKTPPLALANHMFLGDIPAEL